MERVTCRRSVSASLGLHADHTRLDALLPKLTHHAHPFVRQHLMAGIGWMHAIPNPVHGRGALARFIERLLKMDQRRAVLFRQSGHDCLALHDVGVWTAVGRCFGEVVHHEWLAQD